MVDCSCRARPQLTSNAIKDSSIWAQSLRRSLEEARKLGSFL